MSEQEEAKLDYQAGMKYKDIAAKYGVSVNTVKSWRRRKSWQRNKKKCATKSKKGAPIGNHNARGNPGGGAPPSNKNAVSTGEYESILMSELAPEEQQLYGKIDTSPLHRLDEEIRLLTIRERRMLIRLREAEDKLTDKELTVVSQLIDQKIPVINPNGDRIMVNRKVMTEVERTVKQTSSISLVLRLEAALTRVSAQLTKSVAERAKLATDQGDDNLAKTQLRKLKAEAAGAEAETRISQWKADSLEGKEKPNDHTVVIDDLGESDT